MLQVEYVRCCQEEGILVTLQQEGSALAVALPGAEGRALQSRSQDAERISKLQRRMAQLLVQLGRTALLQRDSAEYRAAHADLRDQELRRLQQAIEREAADLATIRQERRQTGEASSLTRSQERRAKARRKRIRQYVDTLIAWQRADLPASAVTQHLPSAWTEAIIKLLFQGQFPWQQAGAAGVPAVLVQQFRDACAEVRAIRGACR